ncbi:MAG TPA: sugar phosphate nucleotidyltransferase [Thermoplasmata archaeon]|jgi:dTDP-glucose pyrophosphorylase|nr:sugar phosphate nucleotidyltransferase [Thermoplasmata archaeon]
MEAVVTLAGEGTRMLPWSRGLRKEFLPLYDRGSNGTPVLKPVAHLVVESLVAAGAYHLTIVHQPRDAESLRSYFSVDSAFLRRHRHQGERLTETLRLYDTLRRLRISYAVQDRPRGFGDAVAQAKKFVGGQPFFLHAGDGVLLESRRGTLLRAMGALLEREDLDAVLLVRKVADPRRYGVVEGRAGRSVDGLRRIDVDAMVEKPRRPRSRWAATAVYAFRPSIFAALEKYRREEHPPELELTDGIRTLLAERGRVASLVMSPRVGEWWSVGSPEGFRRALARTRVIATRAPAEPHH